MMQVREKLQQLIDSASEQQIQQLISYAESLQIQQPTNGDPAQDAIIGIISGSTDLSTRTKATLDQDVGKRGGWTQKPDVE